MDWRMAGTREERVRNELGTREGGQSVDGAERGKLEMCFGDVMTSSCWGTWIVEVVQEKENSRMTHGFLAVEECGAICWDKED